MGQKVNPTLFRILINKTCDGRWFSKFKRHQGFADKLNQDLNIRKYIKKKYSDAGIARVEIERAAKQVNVKVFTARAGRLIGRQGKGIDQLREEVRQVVNVPDLTIKVDVFEVKAPDLDSELLALNVAQQLEKRVSFRRAMKKIMQQAMKAGAKGVKVRVSGRLNGAEMARTEWYREGRIPLHTLRADVDYGTCEAMTTYGLIGVKVWLFKGEVYHLGAAEAQTRGGAIRDEEE